MDRFEQGFPDPQAHPAALIAVCENNECMQEIFLGDKVILDEDDRYYCSEFCYVRGSGARYIEAGLEG